MSGARVGARWLLVLAGAATIGCGAATPPVSRVEPSATERVWVVDRVGDVPVIVVDPAVSSHERAQTEEDDWEAYEAAQPAPAARLPASVTVLGADGPCVAPIGRSLHVEHMTAPYAAETSDAEGDASAALVTLQVSLVAELAGSCDGWLAVAPDVEARLLPMPEAPRLDALPRGVRTTDLGEALRVVETRGEPVDEICPASPTYTLETSEGTRVTLEGEATVLGVLVLDGARWLVADRDGERVRIREATGQRFSVPLPSRTSVDWNASPCL